jgi:hypothetical protein
MALPTLSASPLTCSNCSCGVRGGRIPGRLFYFVQLHKTVLQAWVPHFSRSLREVGPFISERHPSPLFAQFQELFRRATLKLEPRKCARPSTGKSKAAGKACPERSRRECSLHIIKIGGWLGEFQGYELGGVRTNVCDGVGVASGEPLDFAGFQTPGIRRVNVNEVLLP